MGGFYVKVLDVASLQGGIEKTIADIETRRTLIEAIQDAVRNLHSLDNALTGQAGDAIRGFYRDTHGPFLIFLHQSLTEYEQALGKISEAVNSVESDSNGYISQAFLEEEVTEAFDKVGREAKEFADDANEIINRVSDLVSTPEIDESEVMNNVRHGKEKATDIVEELVELDDYGTSQLENTQDNLQTMKGFLSEMESGFVDGNSSIANYNVESTRGMSAYSTIKDKVHNNDVIETEEDLAIKEHLLNSEKGEIEPSNKEQYPNYVDDPYNWEWQAREEITYEDKAEVMGGMNPHAVSPGGLGGFVTFGFNVTAGAFKGAYNLGKDTVTGAANMVMHPYETATSLYNVVRHPIDTTKMLAEAVSTSYERDMKNGDANSRAAWVVYALGSVAGTGGAGPVTKSATAAVKTTSNTIKSTNFKMPNLPPLGPQYQFATGGPIPYNVVDGVNLRDQMIMAAQKCLEARGTKSGTSIINKADRDKLANWGRPPNDKLYLANKKVYDNKIYFDQKTGTIIYPGTRGDPNIYGFTKGEFDRELISKGKVIDRYGDNGSGQYFSPDGSSYESRALPPFMKDKPYEKYEVIKEFEVKTGEVAPWFGENGKGIQHYSDSYIKDIDGTLYKATVENLVRYQYIKKLD